MQNPTDEKLAFSKRLKLALKNSPKKVTTAADLALQFNLRNAGDPVTQQSVHKWLTGAARPTPDKIETLAEWLNVSAQWLRYGIAEEKLKTIAGRKTQKAKSATIPPTLDELGLLARIRALPEHRRYLVTEIVEQFSLDAEMWRE